MLSSKLAGDVTQLKQKAQGKKNLSGTGSRDKEVSPCSNSNPKHRHRSQGTSKADFRRESGGQSDTGRFWRWKYWLCLRLCFLFRLILNPDLNCDWFCKLPQQPVWTVAPKTAGLDWCAVDVKRDPPPWHRVLPVWASLERGFSVARDRRQWRRERAPLQKATPLIKVRQWILRAGYETYAIGNETGHSNPKWLRSKHCPLTDVQGVLPGLDPFCFPAFML